MGKNLVFVFTIMWGLTSFSADQPPIVDVLNKSKILDLSKILAMGEIYDTPNAIQLQKDFQELLTKYGQGKDITLKIVKAQDQSANLLDHTIAVSESIGGKPEVVRKFILTHEIAHTLLGHWQGFCSLYARLIPGPVVKEETDRILSVLGPEAMALVHKQEFEADAFAAKTFKEEPLDFYTELRNQPPYDTATHPNPRRRVGQIKEIFATRNQSECSDNPEVPSPLFKTALNNLNSFQYVRHAIKSAEGHLKNPKKCVSIVALSKNVYLYNQYYIKIDLYDDETAPTYSFQFLFQDASVQAFHNAGGQPWVGLSHKKLDLVTEKALAQADFKAISNELSVIEAAKKSALYQTESETRDEGTISSLKLNTNEDVYLVTWLNKSLRNSSADETTVSGVLIKKKSDIYEIAENVNVHDFILEPLEKIKEELAETRGPASGWAEKLLGYSLIQAMVSQDLR